jgi:hypothetical protein
VKRPDLTKPNRKNAFQDLSNGTLDTQRSGEEDSLQIQRSTTPWVPHNTTTTTKRIDHGYQANTMIPLNDTEKDKAGTSTDFRLLRNNPEFSSMRMNPRLRLLTSTSIRQSTLCDDESSSNAENDHNGGDNGEDDDDDDDSYWSNSSTVDEYRVLPTQVFDVGLMITIDGGYCQFHLVPDANYPQIHPNVYAPASLTNMRILYGGGSGVAVFGAHSAELGDLVMKHGGYKDLQDLFALATISQELLKRGQLSGYMRQARNMQDRLPCFRSIYLSPHHIRSRGEELVGLLDGFVMNRNWSATSVIAPDGTPSIDVRNPKTRRASTLVMERPPQMNLGMTIRIFEGEDEDSLNFTLNDTNSEQWKLSLVLPAGSTMFSNSSHVQVHGDPYESLKSVVQGLGPLMTERAFKFTLAQKTIGGPSPKTGNQWLYEGNLSGPVLKNLMDQMIQVIGDLELLTLPEEVDAVDEIRNEVLRFEESDEGIRANHISKTADSFVGNAIKKNFHPEKGRQQFLRQICSMFRDQSLYLQPAEEIPAYHLGMLLKSGALMSDTFLNTPMEPTVLQMQPHFWRNILRRAVERRTGMSPHALRRLVSFCQGFWAMSEKDLQNLKRYALFASVDLWTDGCWNPQSLRQRDGALSVRFGRTTTHVPPWIPDQIPIFFLSYTWYGRRWQRQLGSKISCRRQQVSLDQKHTSIASQGL